MKWLLLYCEFFKTGVFAVGGGLATLPFLFLMAQDRFSFIKQSGWLTTEQVGNFIAVAQCAPGAIGVNVAAQTGFQYGGIGGGIIAVMGLISPAIMVIAVISRAMRSLQENKTAAAVFSGLRPAAAGLLGVAGWGVWKLALFNAATVNGGDAIAFHEMIRWRESGICIVLFLLIIKFRGHPVIYVALGAAAGILFGL